MRRTRLSEFALIDELCAAAAATTGPHVAVPPGDDAAALRPEPAREQLLTTDAAVEGVHFSRRLLAPEQIGYRALAANLSDIAAMGGRPRGFLLSLILPDGVELRWLKRLVAGMNPLIREFTCPLLGGNLSHGAGALSVTITVAGAVRPDQKLLRSAARPGDLLGVTGTLGDARAGLLGLRAARRRADGAAREYLAARFANPRPRIAEAEWLAHHGVRCAIDLSDGLAGDAAHVAQASRVRLVIALERLPLSPALRQAAPGLALDPETAAAAGGEDFELLFAVARANWPRLLRLYPSELAPLTVIGSVERGHGLGWRRAGKSLRRGPRGYEHRWS